MNDEKLDSSLNRHYENQHLDAVKREELVQQAREQHGGWTMERAMLLGAVAAVLLFAVQTAVTTVQTAEEPEMTAASGRAVQSPEPEPAPRVHMSLRTRTSAIVNCGGDDMLFNEGMDLSFAKDELPISCLVTIDGKRGVFQASNESTVYCDLVREEVACGDSDLTAAPEIKATVAR